MNKVVVLLFVTISCLFNAIGQQEVFSPESLWDLKRLSGTSISPDGNFVLYTLTQYDLEKNSGATDVFVYNLNEKKNQRVNQAGVSMRSPKWYGENRIAYMSTKEGQSMLYSVNSSGEDLQEMHTFSKDDGVVDFKFSTNENYLLTAQKVKTRSTTQEKYPDAPQTSAKIYDGLMFRHWDEWSDEFSTQLFLYTIKDNKVSGVGKNIQLGEAFDGIIPPFSGLENVAFSQDEEVVVYATKKMSRDDFAISTNSDLFAYSVLDGTTKNITTDYKGYDTHPIYSPEGTYLSWLSMEKDGFESDKNDIIIRDLETGKDINLTKEIDLTVSSFHWSEDEKKIYFISGKHATNQLFEYDVKKNKYEQITDGIYNYTDFSVLDKEIIATRQSMLVPNDLYRVNVKNGDAEQLTFVNEVELDKLNKPTIQKRWITTSDNQKMLTWVILPPNFDENKAYPTLLYCQGGPQSAVSQFFSYRWNFRLMAEQGYVIIAPNRRGLPSFGQDWNDAISQDWGGQAMRDYLSAVDEMKKEKYVDENRIGAIGASYGGYSVYYLAGIHEGRFKSFISHCGLFNMESWYASTEELFFANWELGGPYWDPKYKDGFIKNSPHTNVGKWDTPMLVIHGGKDYRVPENQGLEAYQAAKMKGLKSRLLYFPDESHWVLQPQNGLVWHREFFGWLEETLGE